MSEISDRDPKDYHHLEVRVSSLTYASNSQIDEIRRLNTIIRMLNHEVAILREDLTEQKAFNARLQFSLECAYEARELEDD